MKRIFNLFAAMLVALVASATVIDINTGTADALRVALNSAASGDTIVMAKGLYAESNSNYIAFNGKEVTVMAAVGADVILQPRVPIVIKGGGKAILKNIAIDASHLTELGSYEHVIYTPDAADNRLEMDGCELYGYTLNNSAIYCSAGNKLAAVTINNCYIHNTMKSVLFVENTTDAINVQVTNSTFANISTNTSSYWAGIIDLRAASSQLLVDHCTFYNVIPMNTDYSCVSKITLANGAASNCIFMLPTATDGIRAMRGVVATNCITYNYIKDGGTGIHSSVTKNNCVQVDPQFVDAANGNYTLRANSPAMTMNDGQPIGDPRWIPTMEYYLVGNMNEWTPTMQYRLAKNPANDAEYMINALLYMGDEFKIVKSDGLTIEDTNWYPSGSGNNYVVNASGEYTVYFRPDGQGGDGWHEGYIYAQAADLGQWECWFGDAGWQPETNSYITYDELTGEVTVNIRMNKTGQWQAQVKYHGIPAEDGKCYHVALKMLASNDINGVTLKWQDDNNMPNVIYENQSISLPAGEEFVYDEVVAGVVGDKGSNGILVLDFGFAHEGDMIIISDVVIEETECPEPPTYYLVGSMTEWAAEDAYKFEANPGAEGEYMLNTMLHEGYSIKVVGISEGEETWYPSGFNKEYIVDAAHAGWTTVYFRPEGNADWAAFGGYMYIDVHQGIENVDATTLIEKKLENGQLVIIKNGVRYNAIGTQL